MDSHRTTEILPTEHLFCPPIILLILTPNPSHPNPSHVLQGSEGVPSQARKKHHWPARVDVLAGLQRSAMTK
jgi:hypothetical protein